MLSLPIAYELCMGNIHFLLAAMCVVGVQGGAAWAFGVLTKVTPGVGSLWLLGRRRWRPFASAIAVTLAVAGASFLLSPSAWHDWVALLLGSTGSSQLLAVRIAAAVAIVLAGARMGRPWTVAVAVWLSLPIIWVNAWVILLACIRLARTPGAEHRHRAAGDCADLSATTRQTRTGGARESEVPIPAAPKHRTRTAM